MNTNIKVSVIIPIYNVEKYIRRCADSLLEQTLNDVEYIFIDDCSPDNSINVLYESIENHPKRKSSIRIIRHNKNEGLPAARNTGLNAAEGEYIFHCDSDDYVDRSMLESLYNEAITGQADIVWSDWYLSFGQNERYMRQPDLSTPVDAIKAMLSGTMKYNVWNKLVKRSLYTDNNISFPSGYGMGEDMTMITLFAFATKIKHLPQAFYHYNKTNLDAFSQTYSDKHLIELKHNVNQIEHYIKQIYGDSLKNELEFFKLEAKFPLLLSCDKAKYRLWQEWYPEANQYIIKNKNISVRSKLLQLCAAKGLWIPVKIYSFVLNRIIYGIIFR